MAIVRTTTDLGHGITVRRWDTEARDIHYKNGRVEHKPASFEEHFMYGGRELANRGSRDEYLYLNSDLLARSKKTGGAATYECALAGPQKAAYKALFKILGITKESKLSEFINICF